MAKKVDTKKRFYATSAGWSRTDVINYLKVERASWGMKPTKIKAKDLTDMDMKFLVNDLHEAQDNDEEDRVEAWRDLFERLERAICVRLGYPVVKWESVDSDNE